jgi:regulator of sirC expression with transglutaminase-like and TPR domain
VSRTELEGRLCALADKGDEPIDLADAALTLAGLDRVSTSLDPYRLHLDQLAADVAAEITVVETLEERIEGLARVIYGEAGYEGDGETYDDPENADLMRVIDRKKGLPVALGILLIHAARAQGWSMVGLGFPGHFLVRLDEGGERAILDPFAGARTLGAVELRELLKGISGIGAELTPDIYEPISDREILMRLQNNIKTRALQGDDLARAITILERVVLFAPDSIDAWRELGVLRPQLGDVKGGIAALENCLGLDAQDPQRARVSRLLEKLRASLN